MLNNTLLSLAVLVTSVFASSTVHASENPNHKSPLKIASVYNLRHDGKVRLSKEEARYFAEQGISAVVVTRNTPYRLQPKRNKPHTSKRQQARSYSKPDYAYSY